MYVILRLGIKIMIFSVKKRSKECVDKLFKHLKMKMARCSARLLESRFHLRLRKASVADAGGGKSRIIRAALFCSTCSCSIKATLPVSSQIISIGIIKYG